MVAGEEVENSSNKDLQGVPVFDQSNVEEWTKRLKVAMMARRRNHLGLQRPPAPFGGGNAAARLAHERLMEIWLERKDTCVSAIHKATAKDPIAREVIDQYLLDKELLADDHEDKEPLAIDMITLLRERFRGELQDEINEWNNKFTSFTMLSTETASAGIDRLNGIVQKLGQYQQRPSDASVLAKLKLSLEIPTFDRLWVNIAMMDNPTIETITKTCKRYDSAVEKEKMLVNGGEVNMANDKDEKLVCTYSKCGKAGHTQAKCWLKKKDQKIAQMKRAGKSESKGRKGGGGGRGGGKGDDRGGDRGRDFFCFCCGDPTHRAFECPKRAKRKQDNVKDKKSKKSKSDDDDWNKYVNDDDDDDSEGHMISDSLTSDEEVNFAEADSCYLDSCASKTLFIVQDQSLLEKFEHKTGSIQLTKKGASVVTQGVGQFKDWKDIRVCHDAVKNICSAGILRKKGYGLSLLHVPRVVELLSKKEVLTGQYAENGMPYVNLYDLLYLPDLSLCEEETLMTEVLLSDQKNLDKLELLHQRTGHVSMPKLLEGYRLRLFEGSGLKREHLSNKHKKECKRHLCSSCAKAKITRVSFTPKPAEELQATYFLEKITADISVYLNCPSRKGYRYALVLTDVATKYFWRFPLITRDGSAVLKCFKHLVEVELPKFPGKHRINHYHADGGKELIDQKVKEYLLDLYGTKVTWSTTDTPELNSISERKFRTLGEMTLAMLTDSGLPKSYWWDAYDTACDVTLMMPTRTYRGWMSPMECVPGGKVPNLARLRRWGCKCYVLKPKADRRKDWEDKAWVGYFLGYSKNQVGYKVMLQETELTSVHVLFDESIPERLTDYFKELEAATVRTDPCERLLTDFDYLIGKHHMEEGLLYITTRVVIRRGLIVGFRALVTGGRQQIEDKTPIHIADVQLMTEELARRVAAKRPAPHDGGDRVTSPTVSAAPPAASDPGVVMKVDVVPSTAGSERGERFRKRQALASTSTLEQVNLVSAAETSFLQDADAIFLSEEGYGPEPVSHAEALRSAEHKEWRGARKAERASLFKRKVFRVERTPNGVKPIKSKYVYKRKLDKMGRLKKHKARLVAMGYGEVPGVNVWNTFAPVVKGVTVRLLLALAFVFGMHVHQLDVTSAFLYADIEGDVYMNPPPDFDLPAGYCLKLLKSLYGLRSSPRSWWKTLNKFIKSLHFKPCVLEPCLYHMVYKGERVFLTIYVDDIIIACANLTYLKEIKVMFCAEYDMQDMGEMEHYLNVRVTRTKTSLMQDQTVYVLKIMEKFANFLGSLTKTRKYPLPANAADMLARSKTEKLSAKEEEYVENFPFRSMLGALLYLCMNTRPDIAYAVGVLSRFGSAPTHGACYLMVYLMQYVRGTAHKGISFTGKCFDMHIFTDADWAGDAVTRKSTTGYVVFAAGGPLAWQSKLQTTVATSSMQSEYQSMYAGMQEIVWLRGVLAEIELPLCKPTPFCLDSQSAEDLATNPVYHKRSKHIEIKYHWVREHVDPAGEFKTAELVHVTTHNQSADVYTKALTGHAFGVHRKRNLGEESKSSEAVRAENASRKRSRK